MNLRFAEFHSLDGVWAWLGVKEYRHGHADGDLYAVVRHWLLGRDAEIFTGSENSTPRRHGPWINSDRETVKLFRSATADEAQSAFLDWVRAENELLEASDAEAAAALNESLVVQVIASRLGDPAPDVVLLLQADGHEAGSAAGNDVGIGGLAGFVEAAWIRTSDGRLVIVTATDD
jgi:hypothetical protein